MAEKIPEVRYCCEICGEEGLKDAEMRSHMLIAHVEGAIACPFCDLSEITADEMLIHVNNVHLDYLNPEDDVPRCNGSTSHKNANMCSPIRSSLQLNLPRPEKTVLVGGASSSEFEDQVTNCLLCGHYEQSPTKMQEHINRQHFDLTSPSFPIGLKPSSTITTASTASVKEEDLPYPCPLCIRHFESSVDAELHVNMEHKDILSPAKSTSITPGDENSNESCPVCAITGFSSPAEMSMHIEAHFERKSSIVSPVLQEACADRLLAQELERQEREARKVQEQREFQLLQAQYGMDNQGNFREQSIVNMQKAVYSGEMTVTDYYNRQVQLRVAEMSGVDDGHSCTKGLIPKLRTACLASVNVSQVWTCSTVDHYSSTYGDKGWGCGYRNIQMLLSSLAHHTVYNAKLFNGKTNIPSISKIQELIESAWRNGFDPPGCDQLGGKLQNSCKWIGATEVVTLLSSFYVKCQLVDFHRQTGLDGSHPEVFQWVLQYFQKQEDFKPPLYLQHQGHSRTIVGVEQLKDGAVRLLVFDPSHNKMQIEQLNCTSLADHALRLVRKPLSSMKARQYQIVSVIGPIESEQELQQSKILRSVQIPPR